MTEDFEKVLTSFEIVYAYYFKTSKKRRGSEKSIPINDLLRRLNIDLSATVEKPFQEMTKELKRISIEVNELSAKINSSKDTLDVMVSSLRSAFTRLVLAITQINMRQESYYFIGQIQKSAFDLVSLTMEMVRVLKLLHDRSPSVGGPSFICINKIFPLCGSSTTLIEGGKIGAFIAFAEESKNAWNGMESVTWWGRQSELPESAEPHYYPLEDRDWDPECRPRKVHKTLSLFTHWLHKREMVGGIFAFASDKLPNYSCGLKMDHILLFVDQILFDIEGVEVDIKVIEHMGYLVDERVIKLDKKCLKYVTILLGTVKATRPTPSGTSRGEQNLANRRRKCSSFVEQERIDFKLFQEKESLV